jgi:hypothetical protein
VPYRHAEKDLNAASSNCGTAREKRPYVPIPEKAREKPKTEVTGMLLPRLKSLRRLHRSRLQMQHQTLICLSCRPSLGLWACL